MSPDITRAEASSPVGSKRAGNTRGDRKLPRKRMGALPPRYSFALNPYRDVRFTTCPGCEAKTRVRRMPLVICTEGLGLFVLRKSCRLCVACDMVIVHQDELERIITARLPRRKSTSSPPEYLVLGTVDLRVWRMGLADGVVLDELLQRMADFSGYMQIDYTGRSWQPAG